jgi:ankyrin repeat protein
MAGLENVPKDLLIQMALEYDLPTVFHLCQTNRNFNTILCDNETFWRKRVVRDFGQYGHTIDKARKVISDRLTWKKYYQIAKQCYDITRGHLKYNINDILTKASIRGDLDKVKVILNDVQANVNAQDSYGRTPLIRASKKGHLEVVKYLLANGANVNANSDDALRSASNRGHLEVVRYLVEHGANVNALDDDPLAEASDNGHLEVVKYLVENGANVNALNDMALFFASEEGHLEVVKYLVENGANVNADNNEALRVAEKNGHIDIINYLKEQMQNK